MTAVTFTVPGEPVSKARARFTGYGSKTRAYTPQKTLDAEFGMATAFRAAGGQFEPDKEVTFRVVAIFHNATRQRRDVDNMLKLILDGLNKVAWVDDTQVMEVTASKRFVESRDEARTEVTVEPIGLMSRRLATCESCGEQYVTFKSWVGKRRYCSDECAGRLRRALRTRTCAECGKTWEARNGTKFCSPECQKNHGHRTVPCSICGTAFETFRSWVRDRNYCSEDCRREQDRIAQQERRTKTFPGACLICGAGTTRKEYRRCNVCKLAGKKVPA